MTWSKLCKVNNARKRDYILSILQRVELIHHEYWMPMEADRHNSEKVLDYNDLTLGLQNQHQIALIPGGDFQTSQ